MKAENIVVGLMTIVIIGLFCFGVANYFFEAGVVVVGILTILTLLVACNLIGAAVISLVTKSKMEI